MLATHTEKGKGIPLDVPNYLWHEMFSVVMNRKVPTFAPYIMSFISAKWDERRPGEPLVRNANSLTIHDTKKLKIKQHEKSRVTADEEEVFADSSNSDFELPPQAQKPNWATRLQNKLSKTFCLQTDIQHRMYEAHKNAKLAHHHHIEMVRALKLDAGSGSEKSITPKDQWISTHSRWIDDGDDVDIAAPSSSAACRDHTPPFQAHDTTSEELEEEEEEDFDED